MIFRVLQTYPLKMNLVLEIQMAQRDGDALLLGLPLFPNLPLLLNVYPTELYTSI